MRRHILPLACGFWFLVIISASSDGRDTPSRAAANSPDGQIRIEVSLARPGEGRDAPVYRVSFRGRPVISPSRLGVDLVDGPGLGNDSTIESVQTRAINETYTQHPGKRCRVVNRCEEVVVSLRERAAPSWCWEIIIRAYDDGVGIRYRIPKQESQKSLAITGDRTQIGLPVNSVAYALPLNIDFCAEAGIPYHSLDGKGDTAWYGGPIVPYQGADITKGVEGLDLQEVLRYAATKGVKIRLWMNWRAADAHMDRAFPLYHEWGVEGVMLDFMDRDDQVMVNFLRRALETAAANRLTVTLHGVSAPTGLERTYPNLLTSVRRKQGPSTFVTRRTGISCRDPARIADRNSDFRLMS
jgi:Glycoside hydrolase 97/Glycosyl-hydrolase 97 N-terminal